MAVNQKDLDTAREIFLEEAKKHFPDNVRFRDATASVTLDAFDDEWISIELLYEADNPSLDGNLMNTLQQRTREPMSSAGLKELTMVHYVDINDPTRELSEQRTVG